VFGDRTQVAIKNASQASGFNRVTFMGKCSLERYHWIENIDKIYLLLNNIESMNAVYRGHKASSYLKCALKEILHINNFKISPFSNKNYTLVCFIKICRISKTFFLLLISGN